MSSKQKLKYKIHKLRVQNTLLRSDNLIERESLMYRAVHAEAKAERFAAELRKLNEQKAVVDAAIIPSLPSLTAKTTSPIYSEVSGLDTHNW